MGDRLEMCCLDEKKNSQVMVQERFCKIWPDHDHERT